MNIVFMSMDTLPSTLWARDLYDQMHIRSDFRKWFPRMCQYGFIEGRDSDAAQCLTIAGVGAEFGNGRKLAANAAAETVQVALKVAKQGIDRVAGKRGSNGDCR